MPEVLPYVLDDLLAVQPSKVQDPRPERPEPIRCVEMGRWARNTLRVDVSINAASDDMLPRCWRYSATTAVCSTSVRQRASRR